MSTKLPWEELVPMLSINPAAAELDDIARMAGELMDTRQDLKMNDKKILVLSTLLLAILAAAPAAAEDPVRIVIDGQEAAAWRICFEETTDRPGPGFPPQCIDSRQTITDFQWPDYPYRLLVYAQPQPEKIGLETAIEALRVVVDAE